MNEEKINKIRRFCDLTNFPKLVCPYCGQETLRLNKKTIRYRKLENQCTEEDFKSIDFESNVLLKILQVAGTVLNKLMVLQAKFSAFLVCSSCKETVIMVGKATIPSEFSKKQKYPVRIEISPEFFTPPLPIIPLHPCYPENMKKELTRSFSTFFHAPSSSGNAIRHCIERLLDNFEIEKDKTTKNKKKYFLLLSDRIKKFSEKYSEGEMLHSIRFLGNNASHNSDLNCSDLVAAYKILDYILSELYIKPKNRKNISKISESLENKYKKR